MKEKHTARKIISIGIFILFLACTGGDVLTYYLAHKGYIENMQAVLTAILLTIMLYWFGTFFYDLSAVKQNGKRIYLVNKKFREIVNFISYLVCISSVVFWILFYNAHIERILPYIF